MKRRNFIATTFFSSLALLATNKINANERFQIDDVIKPPRLKRGDKIGLIAPAGFITEEQMKKSITSLEGLGFNVIPSKNILNKFGYLAGTDKERADDFNEMFANKNIAGIVCARGGWGAARILSLLDYKLIKNNPKVLVGYSDITSLLYAIFRNTGLITFHGPVGISTFNEFSINNFNDVLVNPSNELTLWNADEENSSEDYERFVVRSGICNGRLIGGNLSIMVSLIGTDYDVNLKDAIYFIEDIGEEPYSIDRMLTQMIQANKFKDAAGIVFGVCSKCISKPDESGIGNSFSIKEILIDRLYNLNIPVIYGFSFGHITNKFTLPFGAKAELNVNEQTLTLKENAVT